MEQFLKEFQSNLGVDRLKVRAEVYWEDYGAQIIVLDMRSGKYFAVDDAGTSIWRAIAAGCSFEELQQQIAQLADDPGKRSRVFQLLSILKTERIIENAPGEPRLAGSRLRSRPFTAQLATRLIRRVNANGLKRGTAWLHLEAYVLLAFVDFSLYALGFGGFFRALAAAPRSEPPAEPAITEVERLSKIALSAFRWYRPGIACMHRALDICLFLRRSGVPADLCLGIRINPFASHAWAEYRGRVLGDFQGITKTYRVIARLAL